MLGPAPLSCALYQDARAGGMSIGAAPARKRRGGRFGKTRPGDNQGHLTHFCVLEHKCVLEHTFGKSTSRGDPPTGSPGPLCLRYETLSAL